MNREEMRAFLLWLESIGNREKKNYRYVEMIEWEWEGMKKISIEKVLELVDEYNSERHK